MAPRAGPREGGISPDGMRRDTTGGNGGSNGAPNKVTPRKKKNAAGVISEVGQVSSLMLQTERLEQSVLWTGFPWSASVFVGRIKFTFGVPPSARSRVLNAI